MVSTTVVLNSCTSATIEALSGEGAHAVYIRSALGRCGEGAFSVEYPALCVNSRKGRGCRGALERM